MSSSPSTHAGSRWTPESLLPISAWMVLLLAVASSFAVALWPSRPTSGRVMWTFAKPLFERYVPIIDRWNQSSTPKVDLRMLGLVPLERRMLASFMSGTPSADLIEVERRVAARAFAGPVDSVGFLDLTEEMRKRGLLEILNPPSLSPWTSRGRIFGLPHDVHPVMLGYRADLVEAAGIDVSQIHTWDDLARVMAPLMADKDGDGQPDRYLINMWDNHEDHLELLLLQAGGAYFDENERPVIDSPQNAHVLAKVVSWCHGPDRIAADAPDFMASGNKLKADGYVVCTFMPDWMCDVWKHELPSLAGKIKLMPLPAWSPTGRRTSVWGGTMLGIPRTAARSQADVDELMTFAEHLYISLDLARELYRAGGIITPVRPHWSDPVFDEPDPYFCGQSPGRMYINMAPHVPPRTASPYNVFAKMRVMDALVKLSAEAKQTKTWDLAALEAIAIRHLRSAQRQVEAQLDSNVFLRKDGAGG
ncbi:MAG: hypothetical protein GIKADHBN_02190 [Phycisphaerales bacterium]|nr:hypothetical protein [Phycisphaerales bacterium]